MIKQLSIKEYYQDTNEKQPTLENRLSKDFRIGSPIQSVKLIQTRSQQTSRPIHRKDSYSTQGTGLQSPQLKNLLSQGQNNAILIDRDITERTRQGSFGSQFSMRNSELLSPRTMNAAKKYFASDAISQQSRDSVNEQDNFLDESNESEEYEHEKHASQGELILDEGQNEWKTIDVEDIFKLFESKCEDNKLKVLHQQLYNFVDKLKKTFKGGKLDLSEQQLGPQSAKSIITILKKNQKFKCKFSQLILGKNRLGDEGIKTICNFLKKQKATTIMHFDASNNNLSSQGIKDIVGMVSLNQNIASLDISSYDGYSRNKLSRSACIALSQYIGNTNVLEFLKMQNCCIGPQGLFSLSKGFLQNKSIISLDLSKNDIGKDCGTFIDSILSNSKIMELNLRGNFIGDSSIQKIGEFLKPGLKMCVLNILDISNNKLTSEGINHFFENLQKNQYVEKLILDQNNLRGGLPDIIQFLQENTNIIHLSMCDCYIYPDVVESIATGLSRNNSLKTLILNKNFVKDAGAEMLAQSMKADPNLITNRRLKVLDISKCAIEEYGGQVLADAFKSHTGITEVDLSHNLLGDASGFSMIDLVRSNQKLTKLNIEMNLIRLDYMLEIQRLIDMNVQNHNLLKEPYLKEKLIELKQIETKPDDYQKREDDLMKKFNQHTTELNKYKIQLTKDEQEYTSINQKQMEEFNEIKKINYSITINKNEETLQKKTLSELETQIGEIKEVKDQLLDSLKSIKDNRHAKQQQYNKRKAELDEVKKKLYEKKNQMVLQVEGSSKINNDLTKKISLLQEKVRLLQNKVNSKQRKKSIAVK